MKKARYFGSDGVYGSSRTEKLTTKELAELLKNKDQKFNKKKSVEKVSPSGMSTKAKKRKRLKDFAKELNANLPASEKWFWYLYRDSKLDLRSDKKNFPFAGFIPDIINFHFKYIIEIQDPTHFKKEGIERDKIKRKVYAQNKYKLFEVIAWDQDSFDTFAKQIKIYRGY